MDGLIAHSTPKRSIVSLFDRMPSATVPQLIVGVAGLILVNVLPPLTVVFAVFGVGLLALMIARPDVGLYLLVVSVPLQSLRTVKLGGLNFSSTEILVMLTACTWTLRVVSRREWRLGRAPLFVPLLAFLAMILLSFAQAQDLASSVKELVKWLELLVVYVLAANLLRDPRHLRILIYVLVGVACVEAMYGLLQFVTRRGPPSFLIRGRFLRAFGTFDQPNPFAGYLNLTLPMVLALVLLTRNGRAVLARTTSRGAFERLWSRGAALLLMAAVIASLSRGAWIALAVSIVVLTMWAGILSRGLVGWTIFVGVALVWLADVGLAPSSLATAALRSVSLAGVDTNIQHLTPATFSAAQRLAYWIAGWRMFSDHVWLGVGMGNYGFNYERYAVAGWETQLAHAHDYYLNLAAETGLVGLFAFTFFMVAALYKTGIAAFRTRDPLPRLVAVGAFGMLITLGVHNLFDDLFVHGTVNVIAVMLGASAASEGLSSPDVLDDQMPEPRSP